MTLRLRVTWKNAGHALLPENQADIRVEADGASVPTVASKKGLREFDIPDGTQAVKLSVEFSATLRKVLQTGPVTQVVLRAEQTYSVTQNGTELEPDIMPGFLQHHPLIDTKSIANSNGAVLAQVHTDFVDIREFWKEYATADARGAEDMNLYIRDHLPGTELIALGFTGGNPKIWFASVPDACLLPPNPDISALVFFRPRNYNYRRIDQEGHSMFRLSRYLLRQIIGSPVPEESDQFRRRSDGLDYVWLRAEFEPSLAASRKPVVLLQPWPNGIDFGLAVTNRLPALTNAALRFLWANQHIAPDREGVKLGRFGISGYSQGGVHLWKALRANSAPVRELYAFDANETGANAALVIRWFRSNPENLLRMAGGLEIASNQAIRRAILKLDPSAEDRVTAVPPSQKDFTSGVNPHWEHLTALLPHLKGDPNAWHQFAIFGSHPGSISPPQRIFLRHFLEESDF